MGGQTALSIADTIDSSLESIIENFKGELLKSFNEENIELRHPPDSVQHLAINRSHNITYGLQVTEFEGNWYVTVSSNCKDPNFILGKFEESLREKYQELSGEPKKKKSIPRKLWKKKFSEMVSLETIAQEHYHGTQEQHTLKLVYARFMINPDYLEILIEKPELLKRLIKDYLFDPLRTTYGRGTQFSST